MSPIRCLFSNFFSFSSYLDIFVPYVFFSLFPNSGDPLQKDKSSVAGSSWIIQRLSSRHSVVDQLLNQCDLFEKDSGQVSYQQPLG